MARVCIDFAQVHRLMAARAAAIAFTNAEFRQGTEHPAEDSNYVHATLLFPLFSGPLPRGDDQPHSMQAVISMLFEPSAEDEDGAGLFKAAASASEALRDMTATDIDDSASTGHVIRWTSCETTVQTDDTNPVLAVVLLTLQADVTRITGNEVNP